MGGTIDKVKSSIDNISQDVSATLVSINNVIKDFRQDTTGTITNLTNEFIESLHVIRQQSQRTAALLTNAILAFITALALALLLHLTHFSDFLRFIVWIMYACLCLHMILTYFRHSRTLQYAQPEQSDVVDEIEYKNVKLEKNLQQENIFSEINLSKQQINDDDMTIVIKIAIIEKQCTTLRLMENEITSKGAEILAETLWNNNHLQTLNLWDNRLADKGVQFLCNTLSVNQCILTKIDFSRNNLTDTGAQYLAEMLETNRTLVSLILADNFIRDNGVQLLARTLQNHNKTLQLLSLTKNQLLTDKSVDCLIDMMKRTESLRKLFVDQCNFSQIGQDKLMKIAKPKKNFRLITKNEPAKS